MGVFVKFLTIISLVIIFFSLFNYIKINNTLIEGNTSNENLQAQTNYLQERQTYYSSRSKRDIDIVGNNRINNWLEHKDGKLNLKEGSNVKDLEIRNSLRTCSSIDKCSLMETNPQCGYCHEDNKKDRFWDYDISTDFNVESGPGTRVCNGEWTGKKERCDELVDREICDAVKDCGDLYGAASGKCGLCPTTMKAYVVEKDENGNIIKDENGMARNKYPNDPICKYDPNDDNKTGLLTADNCDKFTKDNPCITPYREIGPHSSQCIEKMWKKSGCDYNKPDGKSIVEYGNNLMGNDGTRIQSYKSIGEFFENVFTWTSNSDIKKAIKYNDICFGEGNYSLDPCESKFNGRYSGSQGTFAIPSNLCMKNALLDGGCSRNGSGYKNTVNGTTQKSINHINDIKKAYPGFLPDMASTKEKYTMLVNKLINISNGKGLYGFDRVTRVLANKICYDVNYVDPQDKKNIKNGDTIYMMVNLGRNFKKIKDPNGKTFDLTGNNIFKGVVIDGKPGVKVPNENNFKVMWYMIINMKNINDDDIEDEKNIIMKRDDYLNNTKLHVDWVRQYFGWPHVVPSKFTNIPLFGSIERNKTNFVSCAENWYPGCTETCEGAVSEAIKKYKMPYDQVIGNKEMVKGKDKGNKRADWGIGKGDWKPNLEYEGKEFYLCTTDGNVKTDRRGLLSKRVDCGPGKQSRIKEEIKKAMYGGLSYSSSDSKRFETVSCENPKCPPNNTHDDAGIFYKNNQRWYKKVNSQKGTPFGSKYNDLNTAFKNCDRYSRCLGVSDIGTTVSQYIMIKSSNNSINNDRGFYTKCKDLNFYKNNCD